MERAVMVVKAVKVPVVIVVPRVETVGTVGQVHLVEKVEVVEIRTLIPCPLIQMGLLESLATRMRLIKLVHLQVQNKVLPQHGLQA